MQNSQRVAHGELTPSEVAELSNGVMQRSSRDGERVGRK